MKKGLFTLGMIVISVLAGAGFAVYQVNQYQSYAAQKLQNGPWKTNRNMDLEANLLKRAWIARIGLFALRESEVVYYVATHDENGDLLHSAYEYEITGMDLPARYWSFTIYGEDYFLIPNETEKYTFNRNTLKWDEEKYSISLSNTFREGNWLPLGEKAQHFLINLRLYNAEATVYQNLETVTLPRIRKIGPKNQEP